MGWEQNVQSPWGRSKLIVLGCRAGQVWSCVGDEAGSQCEQQNARGSWLLEEVGG